MNEKEVCEKICEIGRRLYLKDFVAATAGNISCRISGNEVLVTPSMVSKGFIKPEDILKVDLQGNLLAGRGSPTSEIKFHLTLIREKPGTNAVVHAHPPYTSVFLITGKTPPRGVLVEVEAFFDEISFVPYAMPGSDALSENIRPYLKHTDAFLLANHGAITVGGNLEEAYFRMELLEQYSKIILLSEHSGEIKYIPEEDIEKLSKIRRTLHEKISSQI